MANQTSIELRSKTIYQVFPRQHSSTKDFKGVIKDLDRIHSLGIDILYFLPIHPIGQKARKGQMGSPYSIVDYYEIDPSLGTLEDFKQLVDEAHQRQMKVMIDIVINHTSRDSVLTQKHPDWFYKDEALNFANRVGDWSDITDLDYSVQAVSDYMINMLVYWAKIVDGFRCDVAPLIPLGFWKEAREAVDKIKPNFIWLAESVHPGFIKYLRDRGHDCSSDSETFSVFDICYDYDIYDYMDAYLKNPKMLSRWLEAIMQQETIYPKNYVKCRSFENHDQERLRSKTRNQNHFVQMVSLMFFLKGTAFIYAGMEHSIDHKPNLFENDSIKWDKENTIEPLIKKLTRIKKELIMSKGNFNLHHDKECVVLSYQLDDTMMFGIFNLENLSKVQIPLLDGTYINKLNQQKVIVKNHEINLSDEPIIIETSVRQFNLHLNEDNLK
jgi:cyclomaltodextrinase / maltogenic alpha-amylase / neopullulanase